LSLIWFTIWSSVVHTAIMAMQSLANEHHAGHLLGDVPALILVAIVLSTLLLTSEGSLPPADGGAPPSAPRGHARPSLPPR
jgi:hypothetical protein